MRFPTKTFGNGVIGVTGGIGSGKSTVLAMFRAKGATVVDSDAIVHELLVSNKNVLKTIRRKFGADVFEGARLNRKALGQKVFRSVSKRRFLEKLIHPLVRKEIKKQISKSSRRVVVVDIPLLFESGWHRTMKPIVVVQASEAKRIARLKKRGFSVDDVRRRMKAQWPLSKKARLADFVVDNNRDKMNTKKQIQMIWNTINARNGQGE